MRDGLSGGAAVLAGKITGLSDFPDSKERSFVEVQPATGGNIVHRLHEASCGIGAGRTGKFAPDSNHGPGKRATSEAGGKPPRYATIPV